MMNINKLCYIIALAGLIAITVLHYNTQPIIAHNTSGLEYLGSLENPQSFNVEIAKQLQEGI